MMSSPTQFTPAQSGHNTPSEDVKCRRDIEALIEGLRQQWSFLTRDLGPEALEPLAELAMKTPDLLKRVSELKALEQQSLDQITRYEAQWQQALNQPHTLDGSRVLGESVTWRKTFDKVLKLLNMFAENIAKHINGNLRAAIDDVAVRGPALLEKIDQLQKLQQERLDELSLCKSHWDEAIVSRKGTLAELDEVVANKQCDLEAAKLATEAVKEELRGVQSEINRESIQLTSLLHQRIDAHKKLRETQDEAKRLEQSLDGEQPSWIERALEHSNRIDKENAQINDMRDGLDDRERNLTERERQFEATCAERQRVLILAEQKLEDDRLTLRIERKKLQDDNENTQRQLNVLCDYRDLKDGQVFNANANADSLRASIAQHEEDKKGLQALVSTQKLELLQQSDQMTNTNYLLESITTSRNDLAAESERHVSQLQACTDSTRRVKNLEEVVIPKLKEQLSVTKRSLEKAEEASNTPLRLHIELESLRGKQSSQPKERSESLSSSVTITNSIDEAALEKCKLEHSDVDNLRDRITHFDGEIQDLNSVSQKKDLKYFLFLLHLKEMRNSDVRLLEDVRNDAREQFSQAYEKLKRAEETVWSSEAQKNRFDQEHHNLVRSHESLQAQYQEVLQQRDRADAKYKDTEKFLQERVRDLAASERAKEAVQSELAKIGKSRTDVEQQVAFLTTRLNSEKDSMGNADQALQEDHLAKKCQDLQETVQRLHEDAERTLENTKNATHDRERDVQTNQRAKGVIQIELDQSKSANIDLEQKIASLTKQLDLRQCSGKDVSRKRTRDQMLSSETESDLEHASDSRRFPDPARRTLDSTTSGPSSGQRPHSLDHR